MRGAAAWSAAWVRGAHRPLRSSLPSSLPAVARSLQTYLNALTYADRTLFPVASPNAKDFDNLVRVCVGGGASIDPRAS